MMLAILEYEYKDVHDQIALFGANFCGFRRRNRKGKKRRTTLSAVGFMKFPEILVPESQKSPDLPDIPNQLRLLQTYRLIARYVYNVQNTRMI